MSRRNTWLVIAGVVIIAAAVAYALAHKSSPTTSNNTATTGYLNSSSKPATGTPSSSASTQIVSTKSDPTLGSYLVDANGRPLYTYGGDTTGKSNCSDACLAEWPIYEATSSSNLPANVTVITRSDGKSQYAYNGLPLYNFTNDGSTPTGDGIANFHLAKP